MHFVQESPRVRNVFQRFGAEDDINRFGVDRPPITGIVASALGPVSKARLGFGGIDADVFHAKREEAPIRLSAAPHVQDRPFDIPHLIAEIIPERSRLKVEEVTDASQQSLAGRRRGCKQRRTPVICLSVKQILSARQSGAHGRSSRTYPDDGRSEASVAARIWPSLMMLRRI